MIHSIRSWAGRQASVWLPVSLLGTLIHCGGAVDSSGAGVPEGPEGPLSSSSAAAGADAAASYAPSSPSGPGNPSPTPIVGSTPDASLLPEQAVEAGVVATPAPPSPGASSPSACGNWTEDVAFSALTSQGYPLGRPYAVWGTSDSDLNVALGVEDGTWPSLIHVAAIAQWHGLAWTVVPLPATGSILAMSGTSDADLWMLSAPTQESTEILRNVSGSWVSLAQPAGFPTGFALLVLGPEHALLSARTDNNLVGPGSVFEFAGGNWTPSSLPAGNEPYTLTTIQAADPTHVLGIGYATAGAMGMGNYVLDAFDGTQWTSSLTKAGPLAVLDEVVAGPVINYGLVNSYSDSEDQIWAVSPDLSSWTLAAEMPEGPDQRALVATTAGTVVALRANYMTSMPAAVTTLTGGSATTCSAGSWGQLVAIAPPGSPNVHVFTGAQAGITMQGAHHWLARVDP